MRSHSNDWSSSPARCPKSLAPPCSAIATAKDKDPTLPHTHRVIVQILDLELEILSAGSSNSSRL